MSFYQINFNKALIRKNTKGFFHPLGVCSFSSAKSRYTNPLLLTNRSESNPFPKLKPLLEGFNTMPAKDNPFTTEEPSSLKTSDYITFHTVGSLRVLNLSRLEKHNSLTMDMIEAITDYLKLVHHSRSLGCFNILIMKAQETLSNLEKTKTKVFCAGGDVVEMVKAKQSGQLNFFQEFFSKEYALNHYLSCSTVPVMTIMDGITMGGGAGISMHNAFRIATERSIFAMPEADIGMVPDVGSSFFLSRLDGELGTYLALTGHRLKGQDLYHAGIATHYIPSHRLDDLYERLSKVDSVKTELSGIIEEFSGEYEPFSFSYLRPAIDYCFQFNDVPSIMTSLKDVATNPKNDARVKNWAEKTISTLNTFCPTSLIVALKLVRNGKFKTLKQCLEMEFCAVMEMTSRDDFENGVVSKLIKKTGAPLWNPSDFITHASCVSDIFDMEKCKKKYSRLPLEFFSDEDPFEYSHKTNALPKERDIYNVIRRYETTANKHLDIHMIKRQFVKIYGNKMGLDELVQNVISSHDGIKKDYEKISKI